MTTSIASGRSRASAIFRVTSGNFLEQFDFFLFGFYATQIAAVFFPASSEFASLMMTFALMNWPAASAAGVVLIVTTLAIMTLSEYITGRRRRMLEASQ